MDPERFERVEVTTEAALWAWLEENHVKTSGFWLVTWKRHHASRYVSRDSVLDALIAYGWIDGRRMKLDEDRTMQLMAPRRQQAWAKTYKDRADRLIAEGRMQPAGADAIAQAKSSGKWNAMAHVDALQEPRQLAEQLKAHGAQEWWNTAAPSYRRNVLRWIASGKQESTQQRRIDTIVDHAARGQKVPQY